MIKQVVGLRTAPQFSQQIAAQNASMFARPQNTVVQQANRPVQQVASPTQQVAPAAQQASMFSKPAQNVDIYGTGQQGDSAMRSALANYKTKFEQEYGDRLSQQVGEDWGGAIGAQVNDKLMKEFAQQFGLSPEQTKGVSLPLWASVSQYNGVKDPISALQMVQQYSSNQPENSVGDAAGVRDGIAYALANGLDVNAARKFSDDYQSSHAAGGNVMKNLIKGGLVVMGGAALAGAGTAAAGASTGGLGAVPALQGASYGLAGGTGTLGAASAAGTAAGMGGAGLTAGGLTAGGATAGGLAGMAGMNPGMLASGVNSGALTTGANLAGGRNIGDSLKAGLIGGITGGAMSGLSGALAPTLGKTGASMFTNGVGTLARGGNIGQALQSGLMSGAGQYASSSLSPYVGQGAANAITNAGITAARGGNVANSLIGSGANAVGSMFRNVRNG